MTVVKESLITPELINEAYRYDQYLEMVEDLMNQNRTTGENHSEEMLHYTKMNMHRMKRLDRKTELNDELVERIKKIDRPMIWLVLTEAWCGDAAQNIPLLHKMAERSPMIELRLILRDEHLEVMDQFLYNGRSRSIPKLVCIDAENLEVLGEWGPRPAKGQVLYDDLRNLEDVEYREISEKLHKWYAEDKTAALQEEFLPFIEMWENR